MGRNSRASVTETSYEYDQPDKMTLCITVHDEYMHFLPKLIERWDKLLSDAGVNDWNLHIAYDDCYLEEEFYGWNQIHHESGSANEGRNKALEIARRGWILYWDADNTPAKGIVEAVEELRQHDHPGYAVFYPSLDLHTTNAKDQRVMPFIDTASLWRVEALLHVGGWQSESCCEDWELSCRLREAGWKASPLNYSHLPNIHGANRSMRSHDAWQGACRESRSLGIICVMRGDWTLLENWIGKLQIMDIDSRSVGITIVDNSGDNDFNDELHTAGRWLGKQFKRYTVIKGERIPAKDFISIHNAVGYSYSQALAATPEDLILTWEDDVLPQSTTAINDLLNIIAPLSDYSVVGAAIPDREQPKLSISSLGKEKWDGQIPLLALGEQTPVGMVGGGFTLWTREALESCPILSMHTLPDEFPLGWDGSVCRRLNQAGYQIAVAGQVKCDHG